MAGERGVRVNDMFSRRLSRRSIALTVELAVRTSNVKQNYVNLAASKTTKPKNVQPMERRLTVPKGNKQGMSLASSE